MSPRVTSAATTAPTTTAGSVERRLVASLPGSELALASLALAAGANAGVGSDEADAFVFCTDGAGTIDRDGSPTPLRSGSTVMLPAGTSGTLAAGADGLEVVHATVGSACDLHAPMGALSAVEQLEDIAPGKATGARSFQVLYDAGNGSTRATLFVGHIPPGKAPWHYHLYDEIVWVLAGEGRLHLDGSVEPLVPGSAFRLHPREVHIVENTSPVRELSVLGLFTPTGNPSAAYLLADVFAAYTASIRA